MKFINIEDINHCWICNKELIYQKPNSSCSKCDSFYFTILDTKITLHIYDLSIFHSNNDMIDIIINLEHNNVIINFIYEKYIVNKFIADNIYKNIISIEEFNKLNLKDFCLKIINSYTNNLLFI